jgi:hypothetical protein
MLGGIRRMRRLQILEIATFVCLFVAVILSLYALIGVSHVHEQEIQANSARVKAETHLSQTACDDVHRLDVVFEEYLAASADAKPLILPGVSAEEAAALQQTASARVVRDLHSLRSLRAADCDSTKSRPSG